MSSAIAHPAAPGEPAGMPTWVSTILRAVAKVFEFDAHLRCAGVTVARVERCDVAVLVGHRLGVDEALVLDDVEVLAGEPHVQAPVRHLYLHAQEAVSADADVHRR